MIRTKRKLAELEARVEVLEGRVFDIECSRLIDIKMIGMISREVNKIYDLLLKLSENREDKLERAIKEVKNDRNRRWK